MTLSRALAELALSVPRRFDFSCRIGHWDNSASMEPFFFTDKCVVAGRELDAPISVIFQHAPCDEAIHRGVEEELCNGQQTSPFTFVAIRTCDDTTTAPIAVKRATP